MRQSEVADPDSFFFEVGKTRAYLRKLEKTYNVLYNVDIMTVAVLVLA